MLRKFIMMGEIDMSNSVFVTIIIVCPLKKWLTRKQYHTGKIGTFGVVAVHSIS